MKIKSNERKKDKLDLQMFSEETKKNSGSDAVKIFLLARIWNRSKNSRTFRMIELFDTTRRLIDVNESIDLPRLTKKIKPSVGEVLA